MHQILPRKVAEQLIAGQTVQPESFEQVTIFFSDVEGFTKICAAVSPIQVVRMLNELYTVMDYCTSLFPLYKVETIGDAYMVRDLAVCVSMSLSLSVSLCVYVLFVPGLLFIPPFFPDPHRGCYNSLLLVTPSVQLSPHPRHH